MAVALSTIDPDGRQGLICASYGSDELTTGYISDYRIYGRILSDAEMLELFTTRTTTSDPVPAPDPVPTLIAIPVPVPIPAPIEIPPVDPGPPPDPNPASMTPTVAWYKFDGDLLDYRGNGIGKDGHVSSEFVRYSPYLSKRCYNLTGDFIYTVLSADGYLQPYQADRSFLTVENLPVLTKLTFSCNINVTTCPAKTGLFDYGSQFQVSLDGQNPKQYTFNNAHIVPLSGTFMNVWKNIAFTIDGKTLIPYDNGIRQQAITLNTALSTVYRSIPRGRIGCSLSSWFMDSLYITGFISDYRIYGRVLSDAEMVELYTTTVGGSTKPLAPPPVPDLVWYKLDGDILNYSGNSVGKAGATSSNPQYSPYLSKRCFKLIPGATNGTGNFLNVPALPKTSALTFSCWINVSSYQNYSRIFDYGGQFRVHMNPSNPSVYVLNGKYKMKLISSYYTEWGHIAFTIDGTTLTPFDTGIRQTAITMAATFSTVDTSSSDGRIGGSLGDDADTGGYISDVRIYGRVLSDDEMRNIYKRPYAST
jgi:Concanavalin A-like lectin/glucanases superfamily